MEPVTDTYISDLMDSHPILERLLIRRGNKFITLVIYLELEA